MDHNFFVFLLFFVSLKSAVNAQFQNCDVTRNIAFAGQSVTLNHLTSHGTCRYLITAPADTFIVASCSITTTCNRHIFTISRAGEKDFSDGLTYCGNGSPPEISSIGNEIVVALDNAFYAPGAFSCRFTSVAPSNANCDCGWSANTKIVGGSNTGINEIVSHAGLVDTTTKEIYCGAIISKNFKLLSN
jgi:hypothetical protein